MRAICGQYRFHRTLGTQGRWRALVMAVSDALYCYAYDDYGDGPKRGPQPT